MPHPQDHTTTTYLAVTLSSSSPFLSAPASLAAVYPGISHFGQVGQLHDVQLYGVPNDEWAERQSDILDAIKQREGVLRVDVQQAQRRAKRGSDEL